MRRTTTIGSLVAACILAACTPKTSQLPPAPPPPAFDADGDPAIQMRQLPESWQLISTDSPKTYLRWNSATKKTTKVNVLPFLYDSAKDGTPIRHLYRDILESRTLNTGILLDACATPKKEGAASDIKSLVRKARLLSACADANRNPLQHLDRVLRAARAYYAKTGTIPIIMIDVDAQKLSASARDDLRITSKGRFRALSGLSLETTNIIAAAPLTTEVGYRKVKVVLDRRFILTNRPVPESYSISMDGAPAERRRIGEPFVFSFRQDNRPVQMSFIPGVRTATQAQTAVFNVTVVPTPDLTWNPCHAVSADGDDVYITPYVFYGSNHDPRATAPEIQRPFVILGGFDQRLFGDYARIYARLAGITPGADFIADLRRGFDVVLLEYSDVTRSLELQAQALACVIDDINRRNANRDGIVFTGISMGGLVSRLTFVGMESGNLPNVSRTHNVRFWATVDTPHQGATIPLSLQLLAHDLRFLPTDELEAVNQLLDSPAAKQMLIEHYSALPQDGTGSPNSAPDRGTLMQRLSDWGNFPKNIGTTVAFSSGSMAYGGRASVTPGGRTYQNYHYIPGECPDSGAISFTAAGCVYLPEQWMPVPANIQSVQRSSDFMYEPQDNRKGLGGLSILDMPIQLNFGGLVASVIVRADDRTVRWASGDTARPQQTSLLSTYWTIDVLPGWALQFIDNPSGFASRSADPGVPYSLMAGGWESTAQDIQQGLSTSEITTVGATHVTGVTGALTPRHTFVPFWSAIDIPKASLDARFLYNTRYGPANLVYSSWYGENYMGRGLNSSEFKYENFVDYDTLLLDILPPFSGRVQNIGLGFGTDPQTGAGVMVYAPVSPFQWVYYNATNRRHGELDPAAVQFLLARVTDALTTPPPSGPSIPPNTSFAVMPLVLERAPVYLQNLINSINGLGVSAARKTQLRTPLQAALQAVNAGDNTTAVQQLQNFLTVVQSMRNNGLSTELADSYTDQGNDLIALLS